MGSSSSCKSKSLNFPFLLNATSSLTKTLRHLSSDHRPHTGKKIPLIAFRQILQRILPVAHIFAYTIKKKLFGTEFHNTKHCPSGLSPRIIPPVFPLLPKMSPPLMLRFYFPQVWTFEPYLNLLPL